MWTSRTKSQQESRNILQQAANGDPQILHTSQDKHSDIEKRASVTVSQHFQEGGNRASDDIPPALISPRGNEPSKQNPPITKGDDMEMTSAGTIRSAATPYLDSPENSSYLPKLVGRNEITIGVELEAVINDLCLQDASQIYKLVADALKPLAERMNTCVLFDSLDSARRFPDTHETFQVHGDASIFTEQGYPTEHQDSDAFAVIIDKEQKTAEGVEIVTPILILSRWIWVVPEMMRIIDSSFNVSFNSTTGLHVHIGIGRHYSLQDLKRIAKAIVLFERHMDKFHPTDRNPSPREQNIQIIPCRDGRLLRGLSNLEMMQELEKAQSINELLSTINPIPDPRSIQIGRGYYKGYRYNLSSVNKFGTVEFRQAAGTIDGKKTVDWINRVIKFVMSAVSTTEKTFEYWGINGVRNKDTYCQFGVPPPNSLKNSRWRQINNHRSVSVFSIYNKKKLSSRSSLKNSAEASNKDRSVQKKKRRAHKHATRAAVMKP